MPIIRASIDTGDTATITVATDDASVTARNVPVKTWSEGGGPGFPRFTAVAIDWPIMRATAATVPAARRDLAALESMLRDFNVSEDDLDDALVSAWNG